MLQRTFTIFTAPNISDPAHLIKVVEIIGTICYVDEFEGDHKGSSDHINYSSTQVIRDLIDKMDEEAIRSAQDLKTRDEVLKTLCVTHGEYIRRVREQMKLEREKVE